MMNRTHLFLKDSTEDNDYDQFLESYLIKSLVEVVTILSWSMKRAKRRLSTLRYHFGSVASKISQTNQFYKEKFNDFEDPLKVIHMSVEGMISFNALLYIPKKVPFNFYSSEHEKGLTTLFTLHSD